MLILGCIADDYAGGLELANNLVAAGMRVVQTLGVPRMPLDETVDAVVISLKARYASPGDAVVRALDAMMWLKTQGACQIYFCFSPTFDSVFTGDAPHARGNIGPVLDALMDALGVDFTAVVPAFPDKACTLIKGHLFVGQTLLSESAMHDHPQTPMTDSNMLRVLEAQTRYNVGLIDLEQVNDSSIAIQERMVELRLKHVEVALIDANSTEDLLRIGMAVNTMPLLAGSPGLGLCLPQNFDFEPTPLASLLPPATGRRAVLCGSCSDASKRQIQYFHAAGHPAMALDPLKIGKFGPAKVAAAAMAWAKPLLPTSSVLFYSTADEASIAAVQSLLGVADAGVLVEQCMAEIARGLVALGVRQLLVAGSETGIACLRGLDIRHLRIGPLIEPGIPWCYSTFASLVGSADTGRKPDGSVNILTDTATEGLHFVVKPGMLGSDDFFTRAFDWMR